MKSSARTAEFFYHCRSLGINGVSLHSYRYAWAERARVRLSRALAQNALGHDSRAVHQAYAKGGMAVCPSLDEYEETHSANMTMNAQTGLTLLNQEAPEKPPFHYAFAKVELDNATAARAIKPGEYDLPSCEGLGHDSRTPPNPGKRHDDVAGSNCRVKPREDGEDWNGERSSVSKKR
jgi:hypothetical protein